MNNVKEKIYAEIKKKRDGVSFAELQNIKGFNGDRSMRAGEFENLILWNGMSEEAVEAFIELIEDKKIIVHATSPMIYMFDGCTLGLPVAKKAKSYKNPRWYPVCFGIAK